MRNFSIGLALLATPIAAQPTPRDLSTADNGTLATTIFVTDDIEGFWKAWEGPTPPHITTTNIITRSRPAFATMVFTGCKPGSDGNCRVTATFTIVAPDGSNYGRHGPMPGWSGPPAPARNMLAIEGYLGFELEPEDKLGPYVIKGELKDEVAGTSLTVQQTITAKADETA
jgi:hypothetical protein